MRYLNQRDSLITTPIVATARCDGRDDDTRCAALGWPRACAPTYACTSDLTPACARSCQIPMYATACAHHVLTRLRPHQNQNQHCCWVHALAVPTPGAHYFVANFEFWVTFVSKKFSTRDQKFCWAVTNFCVLHLLLFLNSVFESFLSTKSKKKQKL